MTPYDDELLHQAASPAGPGADVAVQIQAGKQKENNVDYISFVKALRLAGQGSRSDRDQPKLTEKPSWFDEAQYKNAQSVYRRHFMGVNFAHLSGLLLLVRVDSVFKTLSTTGLSNTVAKLFKRYYHTLIHVKTWYEGDIFEENSDAYKSLLIVRGMHNKVSSKFNDNHVRYTAPNKIGAARETRATDATGCAGNAVHISRYDIMLTQFAFIGLIVTRADHVGLLDDFSEHDLDSLLHFWRLIGHYLGVDDKFNLCYYKRDQVVKICEAIMEIEFKGSIEKNPISAPAGIMSVNIIRSLKFIPMLTIYGMLRYLYEIIGAEVLEVEHKKSWYSSLSYTLISLVMTKLLAYRPLRSFNNGLTRLSVHLTGKAEEWFASHLDSKHGQELKI